jgi:hypothetical protein
MTTMQARAAVDTILKDEKQKDIAMGVRAKWTGHFEKAIRSAGSLAGISVPPREPIIGNWFRQGDLGFICGERGRGKTWLAMFLARKCAEGASMGGLPEWNIHGPRRVLYVDGEMAIDGIRERDAALTVGPAPGMYYLQHEALYHLTGDVLNLAEPEAQGALLDRCKRDRIEILFLDNLSCLFSGIRENDADAWERVLPWLLDLRRNRVAVVFIAHAGRNGYMRGTSRREDAAFWIINLSEAAGTGEIQNGAKFVAEFTKNRNAIQSECPALEWTFAKAPGNGKVQVSWKKLSTTQIFRQCLEMGLTSGTDIAAQMHISKGQVSKLAANSIKEGWLRKDGRHYALKSEHMLEMQRMLRV